LPPPPNAKVSLVSPPSPCLTNFGLRCSGQQIYPFPSKNYLYFIGPSPDLPFGLAGVTPKVFSPHFSPPFVFYLPQLFSAAPFSLNSSVICPVQIAIPTFHPPCLSTCLVSLNLLLRSVKIREFVSPVFCSRHHHSLNFHLLVAHSGGRS